MFPICTEIEAVAQNNWVVTYIECVIFGRLRKKHVLFGYNKSKFSYRFLDIT